MTIYNGKSIQKGIAIGDIFCINKKNSVIKAELVKDSLAEKERLNQALEVAQKQLSDLYQDAVSVVGKEKAAVFEIHRMLLEDPGFTDGINQWLAKGFKAEYAVYQAKEQLLITFGNLEDDYIRERAADIADVSQRLISVLIGAKETSHEFKNPVILVAEDLLPGEFIKLDKSKILALVTAKGSVTSHTAVLAKAMNIPAIVDAGSLQFAEIHGKSGIVDGFTGEFLVDADSRTLAEKLEKQSSWQSSQQELLELIGLKNETADGRTIEILANVGSVEEAEEALFQDAGGIGLYRSEFFYLSCSRYPTEEELFENYKALIRKLGDKKVIIRTLDIGSDKKADYFQMEAEENPALGNRAIRMCLHRPDLFKTQLRAIFRASAEGNVGVMFPLITTLEEVVQIKRLMEEVKTELQAENIRMGNPQIGIMIETPAAALISDELAEEVDFFSIGTNDLAQYTLAADRQNPQLGNLHDSCHPAVMKLIRMTVHNAHEKGITVGLCGELAADTLFTETWLNMGIDELSVAPSHILSVRKAVLEIK